MARFTFEHTQTGDFHSVYAVSADQTRRLGDLNAAWRLVDFKQLRRVAA